MVDHVGFDTSINTKPDIVFIFCDQWNARYLGCTGHPLVQTPQLDALAAGGCLFDTAYTPSPVCMPARASLASGLYPHAHGFFSNYTGQPFPAHQVTLFRCLQQAGYITAKIGKYHYFSLEWGQDYEDYRHYYNQLGLDWAEETSTPFQGPFINSNYTRWLKAHGLLDTFITDIGHRYVDGQYVARPSPLPPDMTADGYVGQQTLAYLNRAPIDKPLFLCASFPGPHTPLDAPGKYANMYHPVEVALPPNYDRQRCQYGEQAVTEMTAQYMGKITHLDHRVGEIIAALKQRGNWENTVIVFSADHGDNMGEHGRVSKGGFQDGSARVPLIISGSAALISARGDRNPSPVSFLDLFPTFLELAGAKIPDYCQATSLLPILRGESDGVNDAVFSEIANGDSFNYMVRDQRWKWYLQTRNNRQGLFDMERDPHEMRNLISSTAQADTLQSLRDRMLHFLLVTQLNQGRGYQPLFKRLGMTFASQDQDERKRIICQRLGQVHS